MSFLERIGRVMSANLNSLIKENEDPERILEQAVMQMEQELINLRRALAEAVATQKRTELQMLNNQAAAQKWYEKAYLSLTQENESLAREALLQRQFYQNNVQTLQKQLEQQSQIINKFKEDLHSLETKFTEVKTQKNMYVARLYSAIASQKIHELGGK